MIIITLKDQQTLVQFGKSIIIEKKVPNAFSQADRYRLAAKEIFCGLVRSIGPGKYDLYITLSVLLCSYAILYLRTDQKKCHKMCPINM